jgi:radical SAM family uncharacterized protein/radical SAM-linked protein
LKNNEIQKILNNSILPFVSKPGRYVGNELNIIHKGDQQVECRIALAFPEVYEIGMSYIGFQILYHTLNKENTLWAERVYLPWKDMEERMRKFDLPLYSLESFTPLYEFDVIGFTLQYELTYTNILNILDLGQVPVYAKDRKKHDPIIIGGGPCTCNPEPMSAFFDVFLIGDGEEAFTEICNIIREAKLNGISRVEILEKLQQIRGVYVPSLYSEAYDSEGRFAGLRPVHKKVPEVIKTRIVSELKPGNYPDQPIVPIIETTHDRLALEVMRGCAEGCRYCNAGMIYRPVRERTPEDIVSQSRKSIENTGFDEVSFLSLSISDYSQLSELMIAEKESLEGKYVNVSLPSMRIDSFRDEIAKFVSSVRKSGFTFAPEAGSERLRRVINKNVTDEELLSSVQIALENGWKLLKFYFMIGLPTETKEDIETIADLVERVVKMSREYGRINFNVSISPFSPKAHTPFQWEKQEDREILLEKVDILKKRLRHLKNIKMNWRDPDVSALECVLGRADRRMADAIYLAWQRGALLDGWSEQFNFDRWNQAIDDTGLNFNEWLDEIPEHQILPWDHIDKGITKKFLLKERQKAHTETITLDCKDNNCVACGIQRKGGFAELADCFLKENQQKTAEKTAQAEPIEPDHQPEQKQSDQIQYKRYRLQYEKLDYARFISHLDLIRVFERAFRKAVIPLRYTEGFNPHPKLSFAPPLSLGHTSEAEYVDVDVIGTIDENLSTLLNPNLPAGLRITGEKEITGSVDSLNEAIRYAHYEVDCSALSLEFSEFDQNLKRFLSREKIEISRTTKGKMRTIDIRPNIHTIDRNGSRLLIKTKIFDSRSVRIDEILENILDPDLIKNNAVSVHRKYQLVSDNGVQKTPIDIL